MLPVLPAEHRTIVLVDVAGFTGPARTLAHQAGVQKALYQVLQDAFAESGIPWSSCLVEDRGDGAMILIPPDVCKNLLVDQLPDRIVAGLRRYNSDKTKAVQVQLRIALHFGEVHENENGVVSQAVNFAFRILDASAAKSALEESVELVAFIASDPFYQEVISQDPAADPAYYTPIPVEVKNASTVAWLRLRGGLATAPVRAVELAGPPRPADGALPVLSPELSDGLYDLLCEVTVQHMPTLVRRVAGPGAQLPRSANAWDVFVELSDVNAGPDGVPPVLIYLAMLAAQLTGDDRAALVELVRREAARLRLEPRLRARIGPAVPVPERPTLHLLIAFEPVGIEPSRCRLSYWRQDDPAQWGPPARTDLGEVAVTDLEQRVDQLILDVEEAWCDKSVNVVVEFLLPRSLLGLGVHEWRKDRQSGNPRPLCLDYTIVSRSLERMRTRYWHRVWHDRWRSLVADPSPQRVYFGVSADRERPYHVDSQLSDPQWVSMVLSVTPGPEQKSGLGTDEFAAAIQSGLPVLIWHPHVSPVVLREVVTGLLDGSYLTELPERVRAAQRTFLSSPTSANLTHSLGLVVLWDDAERLVPIEQSFSSTAAKDSADER